MKRIFRYIFQITPFLLLGFLIFVFAQKPSDDREWRFNLTEKARILSIDVDNYQFQNVRAFEYDLNDEFTRQDWISTQVNADELKEVWFFLEPFPGSDKFGHTLLSFVFEDEMGEETALSISVEARKEVGEEYTAVNALFRRFELLYVWSTEKDVLGRIAVHRDHDLYAYKLKLTDEQARAIFEHFVKRTNDLAKEPRFYNSIHSNCTNELAKAVNTAFPGALKLSPPWILTGHAPAWLHELGYIDDPDEAFAEIHGNANIRKTVARTLSENSDTFPSAWRSELNSMP